MKWQWKQVFFCCMASYNPRRPVKLRARHINRLLAMWKPTLLTIIKVGTRPWSQWEIVCCCLCTFAWEAQEYTTPLVFTSFHSIESFYITRRKWVSSGLSHSQCLDYSFVTNNEQKLWAVAMIWSRSPSMTVRVIFFASSRWPLLYCLN